MEHTTDLNARFEQMRKTLDIVAENGDEHAERTVKCAIVMLAVDRSMDFELNLLPDETKKWLRDLIDDYFAWCFGGLW